PGYGSVTRRHICKSPPRVRRRRRPERQQFGGGGAVGQPGTALASRRVTPEESLRMSRQPSPSQTAPTGRRILRASLPGRRTTPTEDMQADRFFRHLVFNLRTGVLAITHAGEVAAINEIAYRVLGLPAKPGDLGRPFTEVLQDCPEVCR